MSASEDPRYFVGMSVRANAANEPGSRRRFLAVFLSTAVVALTGGSRRTMAAVLPLGKPHGPHPDPRPGIDASKVLSAKEVHDPDVLAIFDQVREIPGVVDGIRCHCGCAAWDGFYSLLSCYENGGMAQACLICQGQAKLVYKLHRDGWSLNGIRVSVDAAFPES
ncbi:MAG: hypothetical protein E4G90_01525 [Gemmatimonadales bacterium]|nr:MAG: hypothetical protein E4G90_01525 [Gemmatimonadales bacterium]